MNAHLSEMLSELPEPLVLELGSGEVSSTEEALYLIHQMNKKIDAGVYPRDINILSEIGDSWTQ